MFINKCYVILNLYILGIIKILLDNDFDFDDEFAKVIYKFEQRLTHIENQSISGLYYNSLENELRKEKIMQFKPFLF